MSATTRKKPIDLSKCKVGQRVKLRNGQIRTYNEYGPMEDGKKSAFPYRMDNSWYYPDGRVCYNDGIHDEPYDIIAILPLPKKAGKPGKKKGGNDTLAKLRRILADFEAGRDVFTKEINRLKGLLKP